MLSRGFPNPSGQWVSWTLRQDRSREVDLGVVAIDGRRIRSWQRQFVGAGTTRVRWDGTDEAGRRVPSGKYFLVATDGMGRRIGSAVTIVR